MCCYGVFFVLYIVVLFFFFKQKTAYEMRISDWSSDVCSSDLGVCCFSLPGDWWRPCRHSAVWTLGTLSFPWSAPSVFQWQSSWRRPPNRFGAEIGRASCRERVCQYV